MDPVAVGGVLPFFEWYSGCLVPENRTLLGGSAGKYEYGIEGTSLLEIVMWVKM